MSNSYYLCIDNSGSRNPGRAERVERDDGMDYFALGGILIRRADRPALVAAHDALRNIVIATSCAQLVAITMLPLLVSI